MNVKTLRARIDRLTTLADGLRAEGFLWPRRAGPMLPHERQAYLKAIACMCDGVQIALETLSQARARLADPQIPDPGVKAPKRARGCR